MGPGFGGRANSSMQEQLPRSGGDPYGPRLGAPTRFDARRGLPTPTATNRPEDCELQFIGGAGVGGPYLEGFRKAFEKQGIHGVSVPDEGDPPWWRLGVDAAAVPLRNDLAYAKSLVGRPEAKAAATRSRNLGGEQYNLAGYSYGAAINAARAYAIAENGGVIDNLILVGAPINKDLYDAVRAHPNIKHVITMDLGARSDPVHAGMTDLEIAGALPTLVDQMPNQEGHFYYSGVGQEADRRRDELVRLLTARGVR